MQFDFFVFFFGAALRRLLFSFCFGFLLDDKVDALDSMYVVFGKTKISTDRRYL